MRERRVKKSGMKRLIGDLPITLIGINNPKINETISSRRLESGRLMKVM